MGSVSELRFLLFLHKSYFLYKDYAPWDQKNRILSLFSVCLDINMWLSGKWTNFLELNIDFKDCIFLSKIFCYPKVRI